MAQHPVVVGEGSVTSKVFALEGDLCHKFFRIRADLRGMSGSCHYLVRSRKKKRQNQGGLGRDFNAFNILLALYLWFVFDSFGKVTWNTFINTYAGMWTT